MALLGLIDFDLRSHRLEPSGLILAPEAALTYEKLSLLVFFAVSLEFCDAIFVHLIRHFLSRQHLSLFCIGRPLDLGLLPLQLVNIGPVSDLSHLGFERILDFLELRLKPQLA